MGTLLPARNAWLTAITRKNASGPADGLDPTPAAADTTLWSGKAHAYVRERTRRVTTATSSSVIREVTVHIPQGLADLRAGDKLTVDLNGQTRTYKVQEFAHFPKVDAFPITKVVVEPS